MSGLFGLVFAVLLTLKIAFIYGASWGVNLPWLVVFLPLVPVVLLVGFAIIAFVLALMFN